MNRKKQYRCSCCDHLKVSSSGIFAPWSKSGPNAGDSVKICDSCAKSMKALKIKYVVDAK